RPTFVPDSSASTFRRIAASMWRAPSDPSIYGSMDVDATPILAFIVGFRRRTGRRLTVSHLVSAAVALAYSLNSVVNTNVRRIRVRDRLERLLLLNRNGLRAVRASRALLDVDAHRRDQDAPVGRRRARRAATRAPPHGDVRPSDRRRARRGTRRFGDSRLPR